MERHIKGCACQDCTGHGVRQYRKGCRCDVCTVAVRERMAAYRAKGSTKRRTDTKPPGEVIGDTHGQLKDYFRGCRCAECSEANRQKAREHRQRVKDGTVGTYRPAKKPSAPAIKSYMGAPAMGDGWAVIGAFTDADGVRWLTSIKDPRDDGWRTIKIAAQGRAIHKANYWGSVQTDGGVLVIGREAAIKILKANRPLLWEAVIDSLNRYASP